MNPPTAPLPQVSKPARKLGKAFSRATLERVILLLVLSGSFWAIWYSTGRLRSLHTHTRQLNQQIARLTAEIDLMKAQWSLSRTQEIAARYEKVGDSLFIGESSIATWQESLQRDSVPLALDTQFRVAGTDVSTNGNKVLTRVRGSIDITPSTATRSPRPLFHRLVDWSRSLASQPRRIDLLELKVTASGRATALVELWTQDRELPDPVTTPVDPGGSPAPAAGTADAGKSPDAARTSAEMAPAPAPISVASAAAPGTTAPVAPTPNPSLP